MIDETIKVLKINNRVIQVGSNYVGRRGGAGVGMKKLNLQVSEQEVFRYLKLKNQEIPT